MNKIDQILVIGDDTKVITLDESQQIKFFGRCIPSINSQARCLTVKSQNSQTTILTTTFDRIFIQKQNFLFVIDHQTFNDFVLIFSNNELCYSFTNAVQRIEKTDARCEQMEEYFFKKNYYIPILKAVHAGIEGAAELKADIYELVKTFTAEKQREYMILGFEISMTTSPTISSVQQHIVPMIEIENPMGDALDYSADVKDSHVFENVVEDRKFCTSYIDSSDAMDDSGESSNDSTPAEEPRLNVIKKNSSISARSTRKRHFQNLSYAEQSLWEFADNEEVELCGSNTSNLSSSSTTSTSVQSKKIIKLPRYKLYTKPFQGKKLLQRLFIFEEKSTTHGYEYGFHTKNTKYYCYGCTRLKLYVAAKLVEDPNGDYIECGSLQHICKPKPFNECVSINTLQQNKIVKLPEYKLYTKFYRGKLFQRLFIFDSNSTTHGYYYGIHSTRRNFYCYECNRQNLFVTAKLIKDPNGDYIECGSQQHICKAKANKINQYPP